ncbi:hypothetical protein COO60DRAFT_269516 [Scenedesmus sp. NREL 46B-D3]|nr:hypothetical protein COO60DRAFT_269516 [Scenedesmus sp. NREL 46B-D3]
MAMLHLCLRYTHFSSSDGRFVTESGIYARAGELISCVCRTPGQPSNEAVLLPANVQQMYAPARILLGSGQERVSLVDYLRDARIRRSALFELQKDPAADTLLLQVSEQQQPSAVACLGGVWASTHKSCAGGRRANSTSGCPCCGAEVESLSLLMFDCPATSAQRDSMFAEIRSMPGCAEKLCSVLSMADSSRCCVLYLMIFGAFLENVEWCHRVLLLFLSSLGSAQCMQTFWSSAPPRWGAGPMALML